MLTPNSRRGLKGASGIQGASSVEGASGVHGANTHEEDKADTSKAVEEVTPDAVISFSGDNDHKFSNEKDGPITISAGSGIDIAKTGNDYMLSIDLLGDNGEDETEVAEVIAGLVQNPWILSTATTGDPATHTYQVALAHSSIMDVTNGSAIDLSLAGFDADVAIAATKYIYLEADVAGTTLTNWTLTYSVTDDPEVGLTDVAPIEQEFIRMRIGKVVIAAGVATATQYAKDCKIIGSLFVSGVIALGFNNYDLTE